MTRDRCRENTIPPQVLDHKHPDSICDLPSRHDKKVAADFSRYDRFAFFEDP